ncbi:MAG: hypothetical protein AAGE84_27010 [Cyanobacteria bacterium P01_G01_bin.39]
MVFSLILELKSNNYVLVTNPETKEQIDITLSFISKVTKASLSMLCQYKYYELIIETERHWNNLKRFDPDLESEIIKEIELEEERIKTSIRNDVIQKEREKTIAKQKHWKEIAAYNKSQKQWRDDGYKVILQCKNSCEKASIALHYADYCLQYGYRYKSKQENIKSSVAIQIAQEDELKEEQNNHHVLSMIIKEQEQKIIALQTENQALRARITEIATTEYINC